MPLTGLAAFHGYRDVLWDSLESMVQPLNVRDPIIEAVEERVIGPLVAVLLRELEEKP